MLVDTKKLFIILLGKTKYFGKTVKILEVEYHDI
jgi:hypothetical protein